MGDTTIRQGVSKAGTKGKVVIEKRENTRLHLSPTVRRVMVEEYAERVRDGVNSQLGRDRLVIKVLRDNGDDSVDILFSDADAPADCDLYIGWEQDVDVDATIDHVLHGEALEAEGGESDD